MDALHPPPNPRHPLDPLTSTSPMLKVFETLQNNIEVDTDVAVSQVEVLERSNIATTIKYQSVNDQLEPTALAAKKINQSKESYKKLVESLDQVEEYADYLDKILSELDQWVSELDVKSRRLCQ